MSLFFNRSANLTATLKALGMHTRSVTASTPSVTSDSAMRHSAVWACLRLRADLISTTPIDVFRRVNGAQVEVTKPPLLVNPGGERVGIEEWLYSTQFDLDRFGNTVGIITSRDAMGYPSRIDLVAGDEVGVRTRDGEVAEYRIGNTVYDPREIWHERQFTVPGMAVGLSPIAYAAWSIGTYLSAQEFALDWFASGAAPAGHLRNTMRTTIEENDATAAKAKFKAAIKNRDILVTGRDWEYSLQAIPGNTTMFLEEMQYGIADVCRFFGVPGDLIDAQTSTGSVTYASITQRNLQLLIMNLQPAYIRREKALTAALPKPHYVKFNTDATVLRMDPEARTTAILSRVAGKTLAPSEARELDNLPPFTEQQITEFAELGIVARQTPAPVQQNTAPVITVNAPPVTVNLPAIDARSDVTVQAPPVPEVHNNYEHVIDSRTTVEPAIVTVDARSEVMPPAVTVNVEPAPAVEPVLTRKRIETDDKGRIVGITEERA